MRTKLTTLSLQTICRGGFVYIARRNLTQNFAPDLAAELEQKLNAELPKQITNGASIYRVPDSLRSVEPKAYEPNIVSIGPYHHGAPHLLAMENTKWSFFDGLFGPSKPNYPNLKSVLKELKQMEPKHEYFYNVWVSVISSIVAILIIYLTVLQTIWTLGDQNARDYMSETGFWASVAEAFLIPFGGFKPNSPMPVKDNYIFYIFQSEFWVSVAEAFAKPFGGFKPSENSPVPVESEIEIYKWFFGYRKLDDSNPFFFMSC